MNNELNKIDELEENIEQISHTMNLELSKNFITPFDREDIHSLASALDDIADYMYASAKKINVYKIDPTEDTGMKKSTEVILIAVLAVNQAVVELRKAREAIEPSSWIYIRE